MRARFVRTAAALAACALLSAPFASWSEAAPPPAGACCDVVHGCCPPLGSCTLSTSVLCEFGFQGDGTSCPLCPVTTTTTTSTTTTSTLPVTTSTLQVTTTLPATTSTSLPAEILCGDFNFDGKLTAADALGTLRAAVGTTKCGLEVCDYTGDDKITASDALAILKAAVGQPGAPMCPAVI